MNELFDLMLNADELISEIVAQYGTLTYVIIFAIIFIETGLVIANFLPGDSLLFSAGMLAASGDLNLKLLFILLIVATVLGNTSNYLIGRFVGERFIGKDKSKRNQYLSKAFDFYEKYGVRALVWSRFFPFMRSFVPFVSGITAMKFGVFTKANLIGGVLWITAYLLLGYYLGQIPFVKNNYGLVFSILIFFLLLGMLFSGVKVLLKKRFAKS